MPYRDFDQEEGLFTQPEAAKPIIQGFGLNNSPTTLAMLGMSLAKSLGYSPFIGGVAGAMLGGVILAIADQTQSSSRPPFCKRTMK
ncbi:hypothetical protein [Acinetobacter sp. ANC 3813]|uniref:hypothetical protein n=1 Tax=Acinetobacter sp. ANC 3813 TaxID=1977873 RepID=UPI000A351D2F|nr:hypothetical protein [Acinetobacter sp. ANC 3813]OTG86884.1 hypothetical protein B9T34_17570 [Acinetobacter sp. ANC 3813]